MSECPHHCWDVLPFGPEQRYERKPEHAHDGHQCGNFDASHDGTPYAADISIYGVKGSEIQGRAYA